MADVFSSQSGQVQFKSPDVPLLVDIRGNLSVDDTIITPDTKDLILSSGTKTVVVDTGGASLITTRTGTTEPLVIQPTGELILQTVRWPKDSGTASDRFLIKTGNVLSWEESALSADANPTLGGNLNVTGFEIYTAAPVPANHAFNDLDLRLTSQGEIQLSSNASGAPGGTTVLTTGIVSGSPESLVISPTGDLYLGNYIWPDTTVATPGYVLTLTGTSQSGGYGQLEFVESQGIEEVYEDPAPKLGNNLNVNGFSLFSSPTAWQGPGEGNIVLNPGSGTVVINDPGSSTGPQNDTQISPNDAESLWIRGGPLGGDLHLDAVTGGIVYINGMQFPSNDGSAGDVLQTNGSNVLSWGPVTPNGVTSVTGTNGIQFVSGSTATGDVELELDNTVIRTTGNQTISGLLTVNDLTVSGTFTATTTVSLSGTITTGDLAVLLNADLVAGDPPQNGGFYVYRGPDAGNDTVGLVWNEFAGQWEFQTRSGVNPASNPVDVGTLVTSSVIWTSDTDGAGSGLDADLLDGQHGSYYRSASNLNAGTLPAARLPAFTGDVTSVAGSSNLTLSTISGLGAGTYGSSLLVPQIDVDNKGRITSASNMLLPTASATNIGLVELATSAETTAGTDTTRAVTPAGLAVVKSTLQPLDATLTSISGLTVAAGNILYTTATDTFATTAITQFGRNLIDEADASTARATLGLGSSAIKNASTTNTPDTVVLRDSSGNAPGLSVSNADTASALSPGAAINGTTFTGANSITIYDTTKLPLTGGTMTGLLATSNGTGATSVGAQTDGSLSVRGSSTNAAVMTFHRSGVYAINLGLDTDNVFRLGGYSQGANAYRFTSDGSGNFVATGNITAYSDIRLKTDIQVIPDALEKVCSLRGVTYNRIDTNEKQTGLIAQELYKVLPEAVHIGTDEEQTMSIAYGNVVGLLVESIKELRAEIEALKADK